MGESLFIEPIKKFVSNMQEKLSALINKPDSNKLEEQLESPTDAIPEPYVLDATKCIAYLTIEHRGSIPSMFHSDIGNRIFGCDDCLDICPYNEYVTSTKELAFTPRSYALSPDLEELGDQTELEFQEVFRRSPLKRAKYDGLQRNIKISKNNSK